MRRLTGSKRCCVVVGFASYCGRRESASDEAPTRPASRQNQLSPRAHPLPHLANLKLLKRFR